MFSTVIYLRLRVNFTGLTNSYKRRKCFANTSQLVLPLHRKWYSQGLVDCDPTDLLRKTQDKEITKIKELFPQPRVTLNELATRTPQKIFDVYYKQDIVTPKGSKRHPSDIKWLCSYVFTWPEKMKFETSAVSKRQAAESAATLAVQWLYLSHRMDKQGVPILHQEELEALHPPQEPFTASLTPHTKDAIDRLWSEYNAGIKAIYEATVNDSKDNVQTAMLIDDTADEDDLSGDEAESEDGLPSGSIHPVFGRAMQPSQAALDRRRANLEDTLQRYHQGKTELPIDHYTDKILSALEGSRVVIVSGSAGCGKSSRVPCALLGPSEAVLVAGPRRLAAIGLATRAAHELQEEVGYTVGYQVRLRSKFPRVPSGAILYCTTGILLNRLQENPGLYGCTTVILDEVHTREVHSDLSMALMKRALKLNPQLKLLLLSATMDIDLLHRYFDDCPVLEVPGRTYPVDSLYLEDIQSKYNLSLNTSLNNCTRTDGRLQINCDEVAEVIQAIDKHESEGAILTFLPGWAEIKRTQELLMKDWALSTQHIVMPVHSRLTPEDQYKMFVHTPPGVRKVVLATNVAETAITVPDVLNVVDCGAHRQNTITTRADACSLELCWVSKASATQRAGRAGRLRPGFCYKLYTKDKEAEFLPHSTPEILRVPLQQVVLECKCMSPNTSAEEFLSQLPQPPASTAIDAALKELVYLGALTPEEQVTRLGKLILSLGVSPIRGRSLLLGSFLGSKESTSLHTALATDTLDLFTRATERREEIRAIKRKYCPWSDHVALQTIITRPREELKTYDMAYDRLDYIISVANLYQKRLKNINILDEIALDHPRSSWIGVACAVSAAEVLRTDRDDNLVPVLLTGSKTRAHISSDSVNHGLSKRTDSVLAASSGGLVSPERRSLLVRDTTLVSPVTVLLFTSGDVAREPLEGSNGETTVLTIHRHKLQIHVATNEVDTILRAREMLWSTFQYYIERDPSTIDKENYKINHFRKSLVNYICDVVAEASEELGLDMPELKLDCDLMNMLNR